jgi:hypothetical protein
MPILYPVVERTVDVLLPLFFYLIGMMDGETMEQWIHGGHVKK